MTSDQNPPRNVVLSIAPATINLSCYGFLRVGRDFRSAALSFDNGGEFSIVPYFLHSQAIELGLKAFLLLKGATRRELKQRPYGHNLINLLEGCRQRGLEEFLVLDGLDIEVIRVANSFYDGGEAGKRFQYFDVYTAVTGFKGLPELSSLASTSTRLLTNESLYDACRRA